MDTKRTDRYRYLNDAWSRRVLDYWLERVPETVAFSQTAWERGRAACRMRDNGRPLKEIAARFGFRTRERARQLVLTYRSKLKHRSPVERFLGTPDFTTITLKSVANTWSGQTGPRINPRRARAALDCTLASFNPSNNLPNSTPP